MTEQEVRRRLTKNLQRLKERERVFVTALAEGKEEVACEYFAKILRRVAFIKQNCSELLEFPVSEKTKAVIRARRERGLPVTENYVEETPAWRVKHAMRYVREVEAHLEPHMERFAELAKKYEVARAR